MTKHQPSCRGRNGAHHCCCCNNRHATGCGTVNHRPLHTCRSSHTHLDCHRQWRLCECQLKTNLTRMYNNEIRVKIADPGSDAGGNDFNNNTAGGTRGNRPSPVISPESPRLPHIISSPMPSTFTSNPANNEPMESSGKPSKKHASNHNTVHNDHVKKVLQKTADIYASMNSQTLTEQENIYSDVYQLYCTVYAENRRLKKQMVAQRKSLSDEPVRGSSSASSIASRRRLDGDGDGPDTMLGPVAKIKKLYMITKKDNYRMLRILSKK